VIVVQQHDEQTVAIVAGLAGLIGEGGDLPRRHGRGIGVIDRDQLERVDGLDLAALANLEVRGSQVRDGTPLPIRHAHIDADGVDARAERRRLLPWPLRPPAGLFGAERRRPAGRPAGNDKSEQDGEVTLHNQSGPLRRGAAPRARQARIWR
jgi:hypothetical protein